MKKTLTKSNKVKNVQVILTKKEIRVLKLICSEKTGAQIGKVIKRTLSTVDFYKQILYKKTKEKTMIGLVKYSIRNRIYELD